MAQGGRQIANGSRLGRMGSSRWQNPMLSVQLDYGFSKKTSLPARG